MIKKHIYTLTVGFENRDAGSGNFRDLMNFLASCFPGFLTKIPSIFSTVTQSKLQKIFVRSSQALGWFCAKLGNSILLGTVTTLHHLHQKLRALREVATSLCKLQEVITQVGL